MSQAFVDGKPTYELADTNSNDLVVMLECCAAEEGNYWAQEEGSRLCAAPFYFERAAILLRKAKDYQAEVDVCRRWSAIARDYASQPMVKSGQAIKAHLGPRAAAIKARHAKAKELAAKVKGKR